MTEWTPVTERLPEDRNAGASDICLFVILPNYRGAKPRILKGYYSFIHGYWRTAMGQVKDAVVHYWTPLPDLPAEYS